LPNRKPRNGVAWEKPPKQQRIDWPAVAAELRAHPGEWLKVFEHGRMSVVNALRQDRMPSVRRDLGFEITTTDTTRNSPRTCTLFMRYNPE
jgi:hypothetical protein